MKNKKILLLCISIFFFLFTVKGIYGEELPELQNGVEVEQDSLLVYYLDVSYDGRDYTGTESTKDLKVEVRSGYITVEDKLPDGLTFEGFVETTSGTFGAVDSKGNTCSGYVVDDSHGADTATNYHGLHYDATTRIVSFKVKSLQAGCKLTIGVKTKTPKLGTNEKRRDFYNTFQAVEDRLTEQSNQVHVFIGREDEPLYIVNYVYDGTPPENAPDPPESMKYAQNTKVVVANNVNLTGYTFSGWKSSDVTVSSSGTFTMPNRTVTLKGSFTAKPIYKVTYKITGTAPKNYVAPPEESYYENMSVAVDSLSIGDEVDGYRFLGWTTTSGVKIEDGEFLMPNKAVEFVGQFERISYKVKYEFIGTNIPTNWTTLLPAESTHYPGDTVTLVDPKAATGYRFLGWYHKDNFTMPSENVVIQGEWAVENGEFTPSITKTIVKKKTAYRPGDVVEYEIKVTNNEAYEIRDVAIEEKNEKAAFVAGSGYEVVTNRLVRITKIPAKSSVVVKAKYVVDATDKGTIKNRVEIVGALADNNNLLTEDEIFAEETFDVGSTVTICKAVSNKTTSDTFKIKVWNTNYETYLLLGKDECQSLYLANGNYQIREIVPKEYKLTSITGPVTTNGGTFTVESGKTYSFKFTNEYESKGYFHSSGRVLNKISGVTR